MERQLGGYEHTHFRKRFRDERANIESKVVEVAVVSVDDGASDSEATKRAVNKVGDSRAHETDGAPVMRDAHTRQPRKSKTNRCLAKRESVCASQIPNICCQKT